MSILKSVLTTSYLHERSLELTAPNSLQRTLSKELNIPSEDIFIVGDIIRRGLVIRKDETRFHYIPIYGEGIPSEFLESHKENILGYEPGEFGFDVILRDSAQFINRICKPYVKLISLFHKENFPLPRFPLGISDIAGAIRKNHLGVVELSDMQFEKSVTEIADDILSERPDIIGISATFGQQDLLEQLAHLILQIPDYNPLLIFGGSLPVLNAERILELFPTALVAKGYGETTMLDVVKYWHGEISQSEINHVSFFNGVDIVNTPKTADDKNIYTNPELDLLEETLKYKGVMQLESSRGCTYHCSFCPRSHKGLWSGETGIGFEKLLPFIRHVFEKYPLITPKIFLVDEEFIGYNERDKVVQERALLIGRTLKSYGFSFESSTRIDQVYRPLKQNTQWQIDRVSFWRQLVDVGLDRMLFGVESGVDSILKRFNKKATTEQNIMALRILTTVGVPLRLTYITFDPLMSLDELIESYKFQGRKDVLLKENHGLTPAEIISSISNTEYVVKNSTQRALYSEITYMLVSMESLIGSEYLKMVEASNLADGFVYSMGKRKARYKNFEIGLLSLFSQKWVDRNFALDYLLKSILKINSKETRGTIIQLRLRIKDFSYSLLGKMLTLVTGNISLLHEPSEAEKLELEKSIREWSGAENEEEKRRILLNLLNAHFNLLSREFTNRLAELRSFINHSEYELISKMVDAWIDKDNWEVINVK